MLAPVLEQLDEEIGEKVKITKMDVDQNKAVAAEFGIMSIPTILVKKDGKVVEKLVGYQPKEKLDEILEQYI